MKLRSKAIILSGITTLIFAFLQFVDIRSILSFDKNITVAAFISIFFVVGLNWVLGFKVKGLRIITVSGYSAFLIFIFTLFIELIIFQNIERITAKTFSILILSLYSIVIYTITLTMNILNVSYISRIPLVQAAKASNFLYTLFGAYFAFLLISRSGINELLKVLFVVFVVFLLTINILWFKKESVKQLIGETMAVVLAFLTLNIVLIVWPLNVELYSMVSIIVFYILLNLGLEERETTSLWVKMEFLILGIVVLLLVLRFASWGINGSTL